jgi:hypothetical protein
VEEAGEYSLAEPDRPASADGKIFALAGRAYASPVAAFDKTGQVSKVLSSLKLACKSKSKRQEHY